MLEICCINCKYYRLPNALRDHAFCTEQGKAVHAMTTEPPEMYSCSKYQQDDCLNCAWFCPGAKTTIEGAYTADGESMDAVIPHLEPTCRAMPPTIKGWPRIDAEMRPWCRFHRRITFSADDWSEEEVDENVE